MKINMVTLIRLAWIILFWIALGSESLAPVARVLESNAFGFRIALAGLLTFGTEWCLTCVAEILAYITYGLIRLIEKATGREE